MRHPTLTICAALFLAIGLTACQYDDFCYTHPHGARLNINTDWTAFEKYAKPTGMSVMIYPTASCEGSEQQTVRSNELTHVETTLLPGDYNVLTFNQSPSEYGSLVFENMDDYEKATVYAAETTSSWYTTRANNEPLVQEPEWIGADASGIHTVTKEMAEQTGGYADANTKDGYPRLLLCSMQSENLVQTIHVTIHLKGVNNYRAARASLTGLAKGCRLATGERVTETATQLLEDWTLAQDPDNPVNGTISTTIHSFGLPKATTEVSEQSESSDSLLASANMLQVTLLLVDEKSSIEHSFAVGDLLQDSNRGIEETMELDIDLVIDESLPDVKPADSDGNGGFNVDVNPWGQEEHHELDV